MKIPLRLAVAACALWCAAVVLRAGQAPAPQATFKSGTDIVQVDVSVLDKNRTPVRGLTAADFTVLEDGKPRPVVVFTPVDLPDAAPVSATAFLRNVAPDAAVATNDVAPEGRLVLIVFDWSIRFEDQATARRIAAAAVDQLGQGDLATVIFTSQFGSAGIPQNFTHDRARLVAAINRPFAPAILEPGSNRLLDDPDGLESGDCYCRQCVPQAIGRIADAVRDVPGHRKVMLFVGTYFKGYDGGVVLGSPRGGALPCSAVLREVRDKMVRAAGLANLTIDVLDPSGLTTLISDPTAKITREIAIRHDNLALLADHTGGRTVFNTNTPEEKVPAIFAESRSYYLLGFTRANPAASGMHTIKVQVKRPGLNVRSREGYDASVTRAAGQPTASATTALGGLMPRGEVPLSLAVAPLALPGQSLAALAIVLGVRSPGFPPVTTDAAVRTPDTPLTQEVTMVTAALDAKAKPIASREQVVSVTSAAGASGAGTYELLTRLELKPGNYEIRVATDAGSGQQGSVYAYVDIPDFAKERLSLSGIVLSATPSLHAAPTDGFRDLLPMVPTAQRAFAATDRVTAFLRVYQGSGDALQPVSLAMRVTGASSQAPMDEHRSLGVDRFSTNRAADVTFDLPLSRLTAGEYLFTTEATLDKRSVRRDVLFTIK